MALKYDVRTTWQYKFCQENPDIYALSRLLQKELAANGIAWHNPISDECCDDFGCCTEIGRYEKRIPAYRVLQKETLLAYCDFCNTSSDSAIHFIQKFIDGA